MSLKSFIVPRTSSPWPVDIAASAIAVAVAIGLRYAFTGFLGERNPLVTVFPIVALVAWWGGTRPAVMTLLAGTLVAHYWFMVPGHLFPIEFYGWTQLLSFWAGVLCILPLIRQRQRAMRVAAEQEESTRLWSSIVNAADDAMLSCSLDGTVTSWNPAAERAYGFKASEIIGKPLSLIIPAGQPMEDEQKVMQRVRAGEHVRLANTLRMTRDGKMHHISMAASPLRDKDGRIVGVCRVHHNIEELLEAHKLREQLLESERTARGQAERLGRVKDEFVATLSHELRTPLNAILGWSQLIRRPDVTSEDLNEGLSVIERNAKSQSQMIEDLLDVSRITAGKLRLDVQRVNLAQVVDQAIISARPAAEGRGIRLQPVLDPRTNVVNGDPTRLQQIVWNLLTNAIKFTPKGGRVQVVLSRVGSAVQVSVSDTGRGIKPEFLDKIFERFRQEDSGTTRRTGGLGLGLSIVRHLTELHGGTVRCASDGENCGATFIVELPLAITHAPPTKVRQPSTPLPMPVSMDADLRGTRVLVVDDERDSRELMARVLRDSGAEVLSAGSVAEALDLFNSARPTVILSDIGMPEQDGYDFIRAVRHKTHAEGGSTPAAALTALARSEDRTRAMVAGFQLHVSKPVEPRELLAVVQSLARVSVMQQSEGAGSAGSGGGASDDGARAVDRGSVHLGPDTTVSP